MSTSVPGDKQQARVPDPTAHHRPGGRPERRRDLLRPLLDQTVDIVEPASAKNAEYHGLGDTAFNMATVV